LLVSCLPGETSTSQLWLVPTSGATPTALTASPPAPPDLGDGDAWQLPSGTYVQAAGACGYTYVARIQPNGLTTPVEIPGVPSGESTIILGAQGDRLAIRNSPGSPQTCAHGPALMWFAPATNSVTPLLGGAVDGGYALAAVMFGAR
jgi:TolB protein